MNKFKIGDKVKNTIDYQTFTIKEIKGDRYAVEENVYLWSDEFLIPVKKNKIERLEALEKKMAEIEEVIKNAGIGQGADLEAYYKIQQIVRENSNDKRTI